MSLHADLREFIALLNSRGIEYVIVGAHSLAFHARPRYTGDLDILVRPSRENADKLVSLLRDFGFGKEDFAEIRFYGSGTNDSARSRPKPDRSADQSFGCNGRGGVPLKDID